MCPYSNLDRKDWGRMESCVEQVMKDGKSKESAIAICYTSIKGEALSDIELKLVARDLEQQAVSAAISWGRPTEADIQQLHAFFGAANPPEGEIVKFSHALLATVNPNKNGDGVYEAGLNELAATLPLMPLDDEHEPQRVHGFFVAAEVQDNALFVDGVQFAGRFPDIYRDMRSGKKRLSIEAVAKIAHCSECGAEFASPRDYCAHLAGRPDSGAVRWLSGLKAIGAGTVRVPAEPQAGFDQNGFVMLASLQGDDLEMSAQDGTVDGDDDMSDATLKETLEKVQADLAAKVAELTAAQERVAGLEQAKTALEAKVTALEVELVGEKLAAERSIAMLEAGFSKEQVAALAPKLATTDEAVFGLLLESRRLKAEAVGTLEAVVAANTVTASDQNAASDNGHKTATPPQHQVMASGAATTPSLDPWAVMKQFKDA